MKAIINKFGWAIVLAFSLIAIPVLEVGCGKTTLDPQGVYAGDTLAYEIDKDIATSTSVVQDFLQWELANRAQLNNPQMKDYAVKLSNDFPKWAQSAVTVRDAYVRNPNKENETRLKQVTDLLRSAVREATKYLVKTPVKPS